MKYCVLLDAMGNRAEPVVQKKGESITKTAHRLIDCETLQLLPLYPDRLPAGYEAVCDENTYGKFGVVNPIASWLYGADDHGTPVVRNAVIFKLNGDDFCWMTEEEAKAIADALNSIPDESMNNAFLKILMNFGGGLPPTL